MARTQAANNATASAAATTAAPPATAAPTATHTQIPTETLVVRASPTPTASTATRTPRGTSNTSNATNATNATNAAASTTQPATSNVTTATQVAQTAGGISNATATLRAQPTATPLSATSTNISDSGSGNTTNTGELGILPTPTGTLTAVPTLPALNPPHTGDCAPTPPRGWVAYSVPTGSTLFALASATGTTVREVLRVNCLADADRVLAGAVLYLPMQPPVPPTTRAAAPADAGADACFDANVAAISAPAPNSVVRGLVPLVGTATLPDFWYYRIEIRPADSDVYRFYASSETAVSNGALALLETARFADGLHWVRVSVVTRGGGIPFNAVCAVPIVIDN
jgi:hypothetical protein